MSGAEFERVRAFTLHTDEAAADRVETWAGGSAVLTPSLPELWDANYLRVERPDGLDAGALAAAAEEVLGGAGARHRAVVLPDGALGEPLRDAFAYRGWGCDRLDFMLLHGTPRQRPGAPPVEEVDPAELAKFNLALAAVEPFGGRAVAQEIAERQARVRRTTSLRSFAVRAGGRVVGACSLLERDGVAEIDSVSTLPAHRGQGAARAAVVRAIQVAREGAAELVFLGAYRDDWPHRWYRRLGFAPVGMLMRFRRVGISE